MNQEICDCCKIEGKTDAHEFLCNEIYLCKECEREISSGEVKIEFQRGKKVAGLFIHSELPAIKECA